MMAPAPSRTRRVSRRFPRDAALALGCRADIRSGHSKAAFQRNPPELTAMPYRPPGSARLPQKQRLLALEHLPCVVLARCSETPAAFEAGPNHLHCFRVAPANI